jgi:hypothetical protein
MTIKGLDKGALDFIVAEVGQHFPCFGGGRTSGWNPIAAALSAEPLQFAAGVDVKAVVEFVLSGGEVVP